MAGAWEPMARHLYIAGPELAHVHERHTGKLSKPNVKPFIEDIGKFRDPRIVDLMLRFAAKKSTRKPALAWMTAHADHARARLELLAAGAAPDRPKPSKASRKKAEAKVADAAREVLEELA